MKFTAVNTKKKIELRITFEGAREIAGLKEMIEKDHRLASQIGFHKEFTLPAIDVIQEIYARLTTGKSEMNIVNASCNMTQTGDD